MAHSDTQRNPGSVLEPVTATARKRRARKNTTRTIEAYEIKIGDTITIPGHWANGHRYDDRTVKVTGYDTHRYNIKISWIFKKATETRSEVTSSVWLHPELEVKLVRRPRRTRVAK
jgi:hypothetical protein